MLFLEKNKIDLELGTSASISVTDSIATNTGSSFVDYMRNRSNDSGWGTTGSSDAALTQLDIAFGDQQDIDSLFFLQQNWKAYTCKYSLAGGALTDFSTPVNVSGNTEVDRYHTFNTVTADALRIIISGTMVADADKFCTQIIVSQMIGRLATIKPEIKDLVFGKNRRTVKTLSSKARVQRNVGAVRFKLVKNNVTSLADLALLELLHEYRNGFLVWPNDDANTNDAGVASLLNARQFWRRKDLFLMAIASEWSPSFDEGRFKQGVNPELEFVEVV